MSETNNREFEDQLVPSSTYLKSRSVLDHVSDNHDFFVPDHSSSLKQRASESIDQVVMSVYDEHTYIFRVNVIGELQYLVTHKYACRVAMKMLGRWRIVGAFSRQQCIYACRFHKALSSNDAADRAI